MEHSKSIKVVLAKVGQAAGTTEVLTDVIDTAGFEGVVFVGSVATIAAGNFAHAQHSDAANGSDAADLEGTKVTPATNGHSALIDIFRPRKRYVRLKFTRGTSTALGDVYAILYGARKQPTTQGPTILAETFVSPAAGTP